MIQTTDLYKKEIRQVPFRRQSHISVVLGAITQEAQASVKADTNTIDYWSNNSDTFKAGEVSKRYATLEQDYWKADGKMYFLPKKKIDVLFNNGCVSKTATNPSIMFIFDKIYTIAGLQMDFGLQIPKDFDIEYSGGTINVKNNTDRVYIYESALTTSYIQITVRHFQITSRGIEFNDSLLKQPLDFGLTTLDEEFYGRLHIENFMCGVGIIFTSDTTLESKLTQTSSPVSVDLPTSDFNATFLNTNGRFNLESEANIINHLEQGNRVEVQYGLELSSGETEWLKACELQLKEWNCTHDRLSITATDNFDLMNDVYNKGTYSESGKTFKELATEIFTDMGVENYYIDSKLENYTTKNPLPPLSHKECLQLIANACMCKLGENHNGEYEIAPTLWTDNTIDATYTANEQAEWSNVDKLALSDKKVVADFSNLFWRANGEFYFNNTDNSGFISKKVAKGDGTFETNPILTGTFETTFINGFSITSLEVIKKCKVRTYLNSVLVKEYTLENTSDVLEFNNNTDLGRIDKFELEIIKVKPFNRLHIVGIEFVDRSFTFSYGDTLKNSPKGYQRTKTKDLQLITTNFIKAEEISKAYEETLNFIEETDYSNYIITFNNPCKVSDVSVVGDNNTPTFTIKMQSDYGMILDLQTASQTNTKVTITINGYTFTSIENTYKTNLNEKGESHEYRNVLIDNETQAREVLAWVKQYELMSRDYEIETRGFPAIDVGDKVFLEIHSADATSKGRVLEHTIQFNSGTMSGSEKILKEELDVGRT